MIRNRQLKYKVLCIILLVHYATANGFKSLEEQFDNIKTSDNFVVPEEESENITINKLSNHFFELNDNDSSLNSSSVLIESANGNYTDEDFESALATTPPSTDFYNQVDKDFTSELEKLKEEEETTWTESTEQTESTVSTPDTEETATTPSITSSIKTTISTTPVDTTVLTTTTQPETTTEEVTKTTVGVETTTTTGRVFPL